MCDENYFEELIFTINMAENSFIGAEHRMTDNIEFLIWNPRVLKCDNF